MAAKGFLRLPWEQRRGEPAQAYARFSAYLGSGPTRSLKAAAKQCRVSVARLKQHSIEWSWATRAAAWDRDRLLARRRQEVEEARRARQRLLQEAVDWQSVARKQLYSWVRRSVDGQLRLTRELTASEALRMWRAGCQAELALREIPGTAPTASAEAPSRSPAEREVDRMWEAVDEASRKLTPSSAHYDCRREIRAVLGRVLVAWLHNVERVDQRDDSDDIEHTLWPWHVPFAQA